MEDISDAEKVHKSFNPENMFVTPGDDKPMSIAESLEAHRLCVFCRKEFSGKPKACPHCQKPIPVMPDALHII